MTVTWNGCNDLDLQVFEPDYSAANPRAFVAYHNYKSRAGTLDVDANRNGCTTGSRTKIENINYNMAKKPTHG